MRRQGTAHLVEVMDAYDLLPVHNFQYGKHPDTPKIDSQVWDKRFTQGIPDHCWYGCGMACSQGAPTATTSARAPTRATSSRWTAPSTRTPPASARTAASSIPTGCSR